MADTKLVDGVRVPLTREEQIEHDAREQKWNARVIPSAEEEFYKANSLLRFIIRELSSYTNETEAALILRYRRETLKPQRDIQPPFYFEPISDEAFFYFYIPEPERTITKTPRAR